MTKLWQFYKGLTEEFEEQFEYLGKDTEKYITFSVPIKKELEDDNKKNVIMDT